MRYPEPLKKGGTIGFIAPSFGCAIEPYKTRFENSIKLFKEMGYSLKFGPNCYENCGLGISNTPDKCGAELNEAMTDDSIDAIITCGGGEMMCEIVPYIDFEKIKTSDPKWYMGYSDNTNYTFLSAILADTAAIYGPCAPAFGREPWHESVGDAMQLLTGEKNSVTGYDKWEKDDYEVAEGEEIDPLLSYNAIERTVYQYFDAKNDKLISGDDMSEIINMQGRLIGGCVDILTVLIGTKYDKVNEFLESYEDDGFIWFLECCDMNPLSVRRAFWQMREAGWFKFVKGFLIGRPRLYGEEALGVDMYNAVTDEIGKLGAPIIMDLDIGHKPPMMPIISGSYAEVECKGNNINIEYIFK